MRWKWAEEVEGGARCWPEDHPLPSISFSSFSLALHFVILAPKIKMPINIAVLGSGLFAQNAYLPALTQSAEINVHTVWSRSQKSVDALAAKAKELGQSPAQVVFGPENLDKVLDDASIDGVIVVLPITKQPEIVLRALSKGKHVLSEKPMHGTAREGAELVAKYEKEYKPKGLIWRVAESRLVGPGGRTEADQGPDFEHETIVRYAADVLKRQEIGPVLYWQLIKQNTVVDGSSYQATEWRTVPDYQGGTFPLLLAALNSGETQGSGLTMAGFLLDGGVHEIALIRTVLPTLPTQIISNATLHRRFLLPHDTVQGIALPPASAVVEPHGPKTSLSTAVHSEQSIPGPPVGKSAPTGSILLTFAKPDLAGSPNLSNGLYVTCLNGRVELTNADGKWTCRVFGAKDSQIKDEEKAGKVDGVANECEYWARAIQAQKDGKPANEAEALGDPRGPMWDVAVIEALLTSDGKAVDLEQLTRI